MELAKTIGIIVMTDLMEAGYFDDDAALVTPESQGQGGCIPQCLWALASCQVAPGFGQAGHSRLALVVHEHLHLPAAQLHPRHRQNPQHSIWSRALPGLQTQA